MARSVPFYAEAQDLVVRASDFFVTDGSLVYDLGTATGSLALRLAAHHAHRDMVRVIGIDQEADMIALAEQKRSEAGLDSLELRVGDLSQTDLEPCDLVVAFYIQVREFRGLPGDQVTGPPAAPAYQGHGSCRSDHGAGRLAGG